MRLLKRKQDGTDPNSTQMIRGEEYIIRPRLTNLHRYFYGIYREKINDIYYFDDVIETRNTQNLLEMIESNINSFSSNVYTFFLI